jgi:hypothetical protein
MKTKLSKILELYHYRGINSEEAIERIIAVCCKKECELHFELAINIPFEDFWNAYDKKLELEKCRKKWNKLKGTERELAMEHIKKYVLATPDKKYRKNPATYLNNSGWLDEIITYNKNTNGSNKPSFTDKLKEFYNA